MGSQAEHLLRSALEKIVFFECRVEAIEAELGAARAAAARAHEEATRARLRQVDLETTLAEVRGSAADAIAKNGELIARVKLLEDERERFLSGLIEQARLSSAPSGLRAADSDGIDLGAFIAELRGEVHRLRVWKEAALAAGIQIDEPGGRSMAELRAETQASVPEVAARFEAAGRLGVGDAVTSKRIENLFSTRAERALYESSMEDLASADAGARRRAAECLRALGSRGAAPLIAAAIGRESDADVKAALLGALAALACDSASAELAVAELTDPRPTVRIAAMQALCDLQHEAATAHVCLLLADPSSLVRRRAVMCLGYFQTAIAEEALVATLGDRDSGVARTAALALSGRGSASANAALVRALDHHDASVRRVAADSVARWAGEPIALDASPAERRRTARRLGERLRNVGPEALRTAVLADGGPSPVRAVPCEVPEKSGSAKSDKSPEAGETGEAGEAAETGGVPEASAAAGPDARSVMTPEAGSGLALVAQSPGTSAPDAPAVQPAAVQPAAVQPAAVQPASDGAAVPQVPAQPRPALAASPASVAQRTAAGTARALAPEPLSLAILQEVRTSLRGCTAIELASALHRGLPEVNQVLRGLVSHGTLVARGSRFLAA